MASPLDAHTVSVLLPAYRRGPHVELTALSWVNAWLAASKEAPRILELLIVDDDAGAGVQAGAVDWAWLEALGARVGEILRTSGEPTARVPQEMLRICLVAVTWPPRTKTSKASVAALNHAAAVARGDVLVLSNAESAVLQGDGGWPGRTAAFPVELATMPPGRCDADPRVHVPAWTNTRDGLHPFRDTREVAEHGGYTGGSCVNVGRGVGLGGIDHPQGAQAVVGATRPWWSPEQLATAAIERALFDPAFLRDVPPRYMRNAADHAWRSHPAWRPTDLHWASMIRRADFWALGGFSARWHRAPTGWGEDGEFAWRVRLWCEGIGADRQPHPFRVSTRTVVAHQWHPSAGGDSGGVVALGESLYDLARWEAWRGVAGAESAPEWGDPSQAFPGAVVSGHDVRWRWHA